MTCQIFITALEVIYLEPRKKESYLDPSFLILQTSFAQEKPNVPFEQAVACN